jgi:hypothetical protein
MAAMRPGAPPFSVGDFIWQEIKSVSENPQKICSFSPFIMLMIKKVSNIRFPTDTEHKPLKPKVSVPLRVPSPPPEIEEVAEHPHPPPQQHEQPADVQGTGGLGGQQFEPYEHREYSPPRRTRSPIKKFLQYFQGICKTQRDIQVAQREEMIKNKKMRDQIKEIYNATVPAPEGVTRSPPSPMPAEWSVPIPSYEDQVRQYEAEGICHQFDNMFGQHLGTPGVPSAYSAPMAFPPSYGNFPGPSYAGYYGVPPSFPYDPYSASPGSSSAPSQDTQDMGDDLATRLSVSLFGSHPASDPPEGGHGDAPQ